MSITQPIGAGAPRRTGRSILVLVVAIATAFATLVPAAPAAAAGNISFSSNYMGLFPGVFINGSGSGEVRLVGSGPGGRTISLYCGYSLNGRTESCNFAAAVPVAGAWTFSVTVGGAVQASVSGTIPDWRPTVTKNGAGDALVTFPFPGNANNTSYAWQFDSANGNPAVSGSTTASTVTIPASSFVTGDTYTPVLSYRGDPISAGVSFPGPRVTIAEQFRPVYGAPTAVAVAPQDGAAAVSWTAPAPTPGVYRVKYRTSGSTAWTDLAQTSATSATVSGLVNGTRYDFAVAALDGSAEQTLSSIVEATPIAAPQPPIVRVWPGNGTLELGLSTRTSAARPADASGARIELAPAGSGAWSSAYTTVRGADQSGMAVYTVSGLTNGTAYEVRAFSSNTSGVSSASNTETVTPIAPPGAPTIGAPVRGLERFSVDATFPTTGAAPSAERRWQIGVVRNGAVAAGDWVAATPVETTPGRFTFDRAGALGTDVRVRARSINSSGDGVWTESATVRPIGAPVQPVILSATRGDGIVTFDVDFGGTDARPSDGANARWQVSTDGSSWTSVVAEASGGRWVVRNRTNGQSVRVQVQGVNDVATSAVSAPSSAVTPIAAPVVPSIGAVTIDDGTASAPFSQPSTPAAPVTGFGFELRRWTSATSWTSVSSVSYSVRNGVVTFTGLDNGADYSFLARSTNGVGQSAWVESARFRPIGAPATPVIGAVEARNGTIRIEADIAGTDARPTELTDAVWSISEEGSTVWTTVVPSAMTYPQWVYTIDGLTNGQAYRVRVVAHNAVGASAPAIVGPVTPVVAPTAPRITGVTTADGALLATIETPDSAAAPVRSLRWRISEVVFAARTGSGPVSAGPPSAGLLARTPDAVQVDGWTETLRATRDVTPTLVDGRYRIDGLTNGTTYRVQLVSVNEAGSSPTTSSRSATPTGAPAAPVIETAGPQDGAIAVAMRGTATPAAPIDSLEWQVAAVGGDDAGRWIAAAAAPMAPLRVGTTDADHGYRIAGLANGAAHQFRVRARNASGASAWTAWSDSVTPASSATTGEIPAPAPAPAPQPGPGEPDTDADGVPNRLDPDADGDGIPNATDPDVDGDGIANVWDTDVDGDGVANAADTDADGDRVPNGSDSTPNGIGTTADIDGDGIRNEDDADMDGDGVANVSDPDIDGDGVPNPTDPTPAGPGTTTGGTGIGSSTDIDGDGIPNAVDPDVDGDGVANVWDTDVDGDGRPNGSDDDIDGDGALNGADSTPNGIGTTADIDGDGIRNEDDADMDGDGVVNAHDPDIDGDGVLNRTDPTPAGPATGPGSTGPGRLGDLDGDGIPDAIDDDIDGDGVPNGVDPDVDGDGVPNGSDSDVDGDGIPNGRDSDVDGDGIPNGQDSDVDGDGIPNGQDSDVDGDGVLNGVDPDVDGDGVPNGSDPDVDGDGIVNVLDPDVDGDGLPNGTDTDIDGDGVPNASDTTPRGIGSLQDLDGDGTPNDQDSDMDGDGRNNAADPDIDGDGEPNSTDTTPAGPGSTTGGTGPGTTTDVDGDGIPNGQDPDVDGDGIPNGQDPDVDGDGIPNGLDPDVDGDGIPNATDPDVDGDGIPNGRDADMDGDGVANVFDPDVDGDGVPNASDSDADGDGIANGADATPRGIGTFDDIDGDGIPNTRDGDIDGDGIANTRDGDIDGDGIPNEVDPDMDGDGVPNDEDTRYRGPDRDIVPTATSDGGTATAPTPTTGTAPVRGATTVRIGGAVRDAIAPLGGEAVTARQLETLDPGTGRVTTGPSTDDAADDGGTTDGATAAVSPFGTPAQLTTFGIGAGSLILLAGAALWLLSTRRRRTAE